jgi:hypothetical protein
VGTSSGANESSRGTEIERVEHLDEVTYRSSGAMDHQESTSPKWRHLDPVVNGSSGR